MELLVTVTKTRKDLIGGRAFWLAAAITLAAVIACVAIPRARGWIGSAVLLMWAVFSAVNAIRVRRVHSILATPVYLAAACAMAGSALGRIDVQVWLIWVLGGGILTANLSERMLGKYLRRD